MKRYSQLYGTMKSAESGGETSGSYTQLAVSSGLNKFFLDIGADSAALTIDKVLSILKGFQELPGYDKEPVYNKPVAVRYCPMYLNRLPDMPKTIQPFSVVCINGSERRSRSSIYTFTLFMDRELLLNNGQYTFLDQIFGKKPISWDVVRDHREGFDLLNMDETLGPGDRVTPVYREKYKDLIVRAVTKILEGERVLIRLEPGVTFNDSAWELLKAIYSLLPPLLAAEIGFATYTGFGTGSAISLCQMTSIRIFVVPSECTDEPPASLRMTVLDAKEPIEAENTLLTRCIRYWMMSETKLPWRDRAKTLEELFGTYDITQLNKDTYCAVTRDFAENPFFEWLGSSEKETVKTFEDLEAICSRFPLCLKLPWMTERFKAKLRSFGAKLPEMKKDIMVELLVANDSKDKQKIAVFSKQYSFLSELDGTDIAAYAGASAGQVIKDAERVRVETEKQKEIDTEKQDKLLKLQNAEKVLLAQQEKARQQLEDADEKYRAQLAAKQEELDAEKQDKLFKLKSAEKVLLEEREKAKQLLAESDEKHREQLVVMQGKFDAEKQRGEQLLSDAKQENVRIYAEYESVCRKFEQDKVDLNRVFEGKIADERALRQELNAEIDRERADKQQKLQFYKEKLQKIQGENERLSREIRFREKGGFFLATPLVSLVTGFMICLILVGITVGIIALAGGFKPDAVPAADLTISSSESSAASPTAETSESSAVSPSVEPSESPSASPTAEPSESSSVSPSAKPSTSPATAGRVNSDS